MAKISNVEAKYAHRLLVEIDNGNVIYLNMSDKLETVRFHDLKDEKLFETVTTDGFALLWDSGRISISLSEIYEMTRVKREEAVNNQSQGQGYYNNGNNNYGYNNGYNNNYGNNYSSNYNNNYGYNGNFGSFQDDILEFDFDKFRAI